ncbi:hypothetical protein Kpho02_49850 [Kitasatospora phosalacinea]|uniref:Uncharacterized protein n=1 Tax=Kitasatospora phosalacinea TaxID=2065 RepID=A0A9W6QC58_9ACTN|nr:hypothetical protein [Kitasatospora phosalacinea]GLW72686.1 hypothetical protein Kpho02_49850 [Kitasatospora phosalacinea]
MLREADATARADREAGGTEPDRPEPSRTGPSRTAPHRTDPEVTVATPARTPHRPSWPRRWPAWAPAVAALWAGGYAALQLGWAATRTTVPWKAHSAYPPVALLLLAALALAAGAAALTTARPGGRDGSADRTDPGGRSGPTALGDRVGRGLATCVLAVAVAVFAVGASGLPVHFVSLAALSGPESATGLAQVVLDAVGAALLLLVLLAHRRRVRGRCPRCGLAHGGAVDGPLVHPAASRAPGRTRTAAYLLVCGLLPWAGVKTVWTLGGSALGVTAEAWDRAVSPGESGAAAATAAVGVDVTVLAALVALLLLLGLLHPWGQVFPRWTLPLAGRRVPRLLPLVPAWLTGVPLAVYGVVLNAIAALTAVGVLHPVEPQPPFTASWQLTWMVEFGGLAFTGLGTALVLAARSYGARTHPACAAAPAR